MANIKKVAELAGVGYGTVSRYINQSGYVSKESGEKIQAAIKELNYKPNELAKNLLRNQSKIIGVMVPNIEHPFFAKFLQYAEMELYHSGYKVIVCSTTEIRKKGNDFLDLLDNHLLDGIITGIDRWEDPRLDHITKPIVSLDRNWGNSVPIVHSDHIKSGNLLAENVIRSGCRSVVHFATSGHNSDPFAIRNLILLDALQRAGIPVRHIEISWDVLDFEYCNKIVEEHIMDLKKRDCIYASDLIALSCLSAAHKNGIKVPEDLKLISTDGVNITRLSYPVITCVRQDIEKLASTCASTILSMIQHKTDIPHEQIVDVGFQSGGTI